MVKSKPRAEEQPLIIKNRFKTARKRYQNASKFVTSKESVLTLLLNFSIHLIYYSIISPTHYFSVSPELLDILVNSCVSTFLRCTYPLAGYLADNHFGRYWTVFCSLKILKPGVALCLIGGSVMISAIVCSNRIQQSVFLVLLSIGVMVLVPGLILVLIGMIGFKANIIQFGLDQLFDSPWEDQVVYVYWFMWTSFCPRLIIHLLFKIAKEVNSSTVVQYCAIGVAVFVAGVLVTALLWVATHHNNWFLISMSSFNPYRLVYLVTQFSMKHKVPVYRSALTYCEDKVPTGLDLGKSKYGGPFTTEQVEDVKVFYGILKVLLAMGPIFTLCYMSDPMILIFQANIESHINNKELMSNISTSKWQKTGEVLLDVLDQIVVLLLIPFYLLCVRPFVSYYTPGVLKKVGLSMAAILCMLVALTVIIVTVNDNCHDNRCIFELKTIAINESVSISHKDKLPALARNFKYISIAHRAITNILVVIIHVAMYEFVCSQSPHTMKGLLIGVSYAIRACFDIMGPLLAVLLGCVWHKIERDKEGGSKKGWFLNCSMVYYSSAIILGMICLLLYIYIAKGYRYRVRDEECNVQQYVENYYYKYAGLVSKRKKRVVQTKMDLTVSDV